MSRRTARGPKRTPAGRARAARRLARGRRHPARRPSLARGSVGASWAHGRRILSSVPVAAWGCAVVACLNAVSWSAISPPFEVPDEPSHFAYVQHLAETGTRPPVNGLYFSPTETVALRDLHYPQVRGRPQNGTISSPREQRTLERDLAENPSTASEDGGVATPEPPLYYALETVPYRLAGGNILDRLTLMRLLSALMAGFTGLFAYLFVRELLPGVRWAWTVGGLGVALFPLLGFMSGAVSPDAMLFAVATALFFTLARAFRLGLTPARGCAIGAVIAIGLMTKLNFAGLVPGATLGLIALTLRVGRASRRAALRSLALAFGVAASPLLLYVVTDALTHHVGGFNLVSIGNEFIGLHGSVLGKISYIWELFLPRLPGMQGFFHDISTTRQLWFDGLVGRYGWLDTFFPGWVYDVALLPVALIAGLCVRELIRGRVALRSRKVELAVYLTVGVGVMAQVGATDYFSYPALEGAYIEPRYLLPLIALFGGALTLAARGAGRRWGHSVGAILILLFLGHDIFSQLLVISRYYR
jgi:Predicted membrane protein (DUF2142)